MWVIGAAPQAGTITCNNQTSLTFAGVQVGTDIATLNYGGGWNLHFGATAGYLGAKTRDTSSPGPLNPAGGTLTDQLQVPFPVSTRWRPKAGSSSTVRFARISSRIQ